SLYLQEILGYSPIQAGLAWLPQTVLIMVVSSIGARIATKLGERTLIALGTIVLAAGMLLFLRTAPESDYVTVLIPAILGAAISVAAGMMALIVIKRPSARPTAGVAQTVPLRPIQPLTAAAQSQLLLARCGSLIPPDYVEELTAGT